MSSRSRRNRNRQPQSQPTPTQATDESVIEGWFATASDEVKEKFDLDVLDQAQVLWTEGHVEINFEEAVWVKYVAEQIAVALEVKIKPWKIHTYDQPKGGRFHVWAKLEIAA